MHLWLRLCTAALITFLSLSPFYLPVSRFISVSRGTHQVQSSIVLPDIFRKTPSKLNKEKRLSAEGILFFGSFSVSPSQISISLSAVLTAHRGSSWHRRTPAIQLGGAAGPAGAACFESDGRRLEQRAGAGRSGRGPQEALKTEGPCRSHTTHCTSIQRWARFLTP